MNGLTQDNLDVDMTALMKFIAEGKQMKCVTELLTSMHVTTLVYG